MQREVLTAKFRKTYLRRLKSMIMQGKVIWPDADKVLAKVAAKDWVVNVQAPPPKYQGSEAVINYLASSVIGGPISDVRIISDDGKLVTFRFKNYKTDKIEYETIPGEEFVRRYLLHILPRGMIRVLAKAEEWRPEAREERVIGHIDRTNFPSLKRITVSECRPHSTWHRNSNLRPTVSSLPPANDPRPLMRAVLGKDHPLIREAEKNAARPPLESDNEAANA